MRPRRIAYIIPLAAQKRPTIATIPATLSSDAAPFTAFSRSRFAVSESGSALVSHATKRSRRASFCMTRPATETIRIRNGKIEKRTL